MRRIAMVKGSILTVGYEGRSIPEAVVEFHGETGAKRAWVEASRWRALGSVLCYGGSDSFRPCGSSLASYAVTLVNKMPAVRLAERG